MWPSQSRASANLRRKAQTPNPARASRQNEEQASDAALHNELNRLFSDCQIFQAQLQEANTKLRQAGEDVAYLRNKLKEYQAANQDLVKHSIALIEENRALREKHNAHGLFSGTSSGDPNNVALPDRPQSSLNKNRKDQREDRGHKKGKSREDSRQYVQSSQEAEKDRLKGRFGDSPSSASGHRNSFAGQMNNGVRLTRSRTPAYEPKAGIWHEQQGGASLGGYPRGF
ncbi:hypothetical protein NOR_05450 [Metarhizium rileyi]|uniref:Uncharacterized protein n=1 Tax=Metarhizium rileyi (strain RCEF 4871) TaxID=1649241 RepID=A0A167CMW9_METRR|nr:hypothetical protein NOR_05450 [Metarhizium rileyi RCEF 4871]TWU74121.1 hypothetical protein ED733_005225 [Metarhizium rileyi]